MQGKRPPIASLVRKLWINIDQAPTITPMHRQAMLLIVPPAYIRLNCGFPAASDGALERVNQAIQEYRRDVTQLDMSAYYTMMSKLTRHGTDAPSEPVLNDDEPVRAEGSPTFLHDTPPSKRQRTHTAAPSDDELAATSVAQQDYTSSHRPVAPSDSDTEWELDDEPWDGAARHGAARHGAA